MKNANTTASLSLSPDSITVNGRTFPASYSLARTGDVYVFASVKTAADAEAIPVRLHISANMPMHAEAVAAAEASRKAAKAETISASKPAAQEVAPAPVQEQPAPVQEAPAPADKPAPAKKASRKASKPAAQEVAPAPVQEQPAPAPVQEAPAPADKPAPAKKASRKASKPAAQEVAPAPVQEQPAPAPVQEQPAPVAGKVWIGTTIQGKGWSIAFDADAGRTRVQVEGTPTDAQRSAIEQAGFYWSSQLKSWNKKLTCKAYRAAQALATTLNALA